MKFRRQKLDDVQINLTPLIDVVFLLLLFFVISTTFNHRSELTIDLPSSEAGAPANDNSKDVDIVVTADGQYVINGQTLINEKTNTLVQGIKEVSHGDYSRPLIITADAKAPYEMVLKIYDAASQLGITKIAHTTQKEPAK
ncbi:Biopolymer transport protein ExbD [Marinomonas spartinae]|uniref:Biopolymer transport protein ExbD n=1 Tax=Marinomonas spartinae TaxID=1792290 RepID=A0A1A8TKY2_9GAMM|nr:biopolymer transporter ExbD [Marinomonas spartinae]SBS34247.1 Biopolymer transport protein ExbD [Marinomonas spartinae]SBS37625.1 Biopolymer transport protein ExbD [Marinomonas spartinae]